MSEESLADRITEWRAALRGVIEDAERKLGVNEALPITAPALLAWEACGKIAENRNR